MSSRLITPVLLCLAAAANAQTFLVNDTFEDGDRLNQNAPDSLRWTAGAYNGSTDAFADLTVSDGKLVLDHTDDNGSSYALALAYFTDPGAPFMLSLGQTLRLSFDVSFENGTLGNSGNGFRWALLDSGGVRVTSDFSGGNETGIASGTTFSGWRGYEALVPVASSTNADFQIRERNGATTGSTNGLFTSSNWMHFAPSTVAEPLLSAGVTYSGFLELTRSSAGITLSAGMAGVTTTSVLDSNLPRITFDTVAFFVLNTVPTDVVLDNVQVTVVPEPSTAVAMLMGAAVLGCVRRRRRR